MGANTRGAPQEQGHLPAGSDGDATAEAPRLIKRGRRKIRNCDKKSNTRRAADNVALIALARAKKRLA